MPGKQDLTQNRPSIVDLCASTVTDDEQGIVVAISSELVFALSCACTFVRAQPWPLPFLAMRHGSTTVSQSSGPLNLSHPFAFAYFRVLDATAIRLRARLGDESRMLEEWNKVVLRGHSLATQRATYASFHSV